jgi:uncharacterized protein (TIGR02147 family)
VPYIFDYTDFRQFLRDFYALQKKSLKCFSYKYFSNKAGFKNKGFIYNIFNGTKRLSKTNVFRLCSAMNLNQHECDYFENMVAYNQATSPDEREHFFRRMQSAKVPGRKRTKTQIVRSDQYEFYSQWHHSVIRSLVDLQNAGDDYKWLAKHVRPQISAWDARRSLELLKRLGLVVKTPGGAYKIKDRSISTGHDVRSTALFAFYLQHLKLAADALQKVPRDKRNFSGITLGISKATYDRICEELRALFEKIMAMVEEDKNADSVYQLNFQLYPVSSTVKKEIDHE